MADNDLIILKNSNPLNKYPVDADQLNHNFDLLNKNQGGAAIKQLIESTGQVYTPIIDEQLSMAIAQYVLSCELFDEKGTNDAFILQPKDGFARPYRYTWGMTVSFVPTRTNTGPMTIQIGPLDPYPVYIGTNETPAGYINANTLNTFKFLGTYWTQVTSTGSTGITGNTGGASGTSTDSTTLTNVIRTAITSAGLTYDTTDNTQLAKAMANYVSNNLYSATLANSNYVLAPFGTAYVPTKYTQNMLVWFIADKNNTTNPTLSIKGLQQTVILDFFNNPLPANTISAGEVVTCIFDGSAFKLVSQYKGALSLSNGVRVTTISNDTGLASASETALVTERAVKTYVDAKVKGTKANIVVSGYEVNDEPSALRIISSHTMQLLAGTGSSTEKTIEEFTPASTGNIISSGNTAKAINAVSKLNNVYWESEKSGFAVDDIKRKVTGTSGSKYITISYDSLGNQLYLHTPAAPCYFGFKGLTKLYEIIKIKHTDTNHTPQTIKLYVNTSATLEDSLWIPLCNRLGTEGAYYADYSYGMLTSLTTVDGYYVIEIPTYVEQNGTITAFSPASSYALKIVATEFDQQFATTETINAAGYDPNNDTTATTTKYSWQIADVVLGNYLVGVDPFVVSYPDGSLENIITSLYYTQYITNSTQDNAVKLSVLENGRYILYKLYGIDTLYSIDKDLVFRQSMQPPATAENAGGIWIDLSSAPYQSYICNTRGDEETGAITYSWDKTSVMLLGGMDVLNNNFTKAINYRYGDSYIDDYSVSSTQNITITHNFGSDTTIHCYLQCTAANNSYVVGEQIVLAPYTNTSYKLTGDIVKGYKLEQTLSYFNITNTNITTKINLYNLQIINRTTNTLVTIPNNSWILRVYINKD